MTTTVTQEAGYTGFSPKIPRVITQSTLVQVTTAGWWNNNPTTGEPPLNSQDLVCICYAFGTSSQATALFGVSIGANGVVTLALEESTVVLPVVSGHFANFSGTSGAIADDGYLPSNAAKTRVVMANGTSIANHIATYADTTGTIGEDVATAINGGNLQAGLSGTAGKVTSFPGTASNGNMSMAAVNNSGNKALTLSNISTLGQDTVLTFNDPGAATANVIVSTAGSAQTIAGGLTISTGNLGVTAGNVTAGSSGHAGTVTSFPTTASNGSFIWAAVGNSGGFAATVSPKSTLGQATVYTIPDPGAATANFLLDAGTNASITATTGTFTNLKYGATPVAQVDPGSCTITAAAGASNTCTITVQLKDGSGTNMTRVLPFKVYLATDATGLTLQSAASTGYSVTSGGVNDPTGSTTITQGLAAFSSASGGCVLSLLDTGKGTGNLILMLPNGFKASAAITSGSYGA